MKTKQVVKQLKTQNISSFVKKINPEQFQIKATQTTKSLLLSSVSALIQSPTGSGKTVMACMLIEDWIQQQSKILVLVNTQQLLVQFYSTLKDFGITASVFHNDITRGEPSEENPKGELLLYRKYNPIQVTMPITFMNKDKIKGKSEFDKDWQPDYIVIDEAHKGTSLFYQKIRDMYPNAKILGLTATPYRANNDEGEHLVQWYGDRLITTISIKELANIGRLVLPEYLQCDSDQHLVEYWFEKCRDELTIVFTSNLDECKMVKQSFTHYGVPTEYLTSGDETESGQTPQERQRIFDKFKRGELKVLVSCGILCEGFDCPPAKVCILFRRIDTLSLYHQIVGRVLRAYKGKKSATVIDCRDNVERFGYVEDWVWKLGEELPSTTLSRPGDNVIYHDFISKHRKHIYRCHCGHLYDLRESRVCNYKGCTLKANVKFITSPMREMNKMIPQIIDGVGFKKVLFDWNEFETTKTVVFKIQKAKAFNMRYGNGKDIINLQTGILGEGFEKLPEILKMHRSIFNSYEVTV